MAEIVTISEAARMFDKHPLTVRRAIDNGRIPLRARLSDHIWLITLQSCCQRWGAPTSAINPCYNN